MIDPGTDKKKFEDFFLEDIVGVYDSEGWADSSERDEVLIGLTEVANPSESLDPTLQEIGPDQHIHLDIDGGLDWEVHNNDDDVGDGVHLSLIHI